TQPHISNFLDFCKVLLCLDEKKWNEQKNQILGYIINRDQRTGRWTLTTGTVLQYNIVPLPDGASLLTVSDVSDTLQIEKALQDKNRALETADKLKAEFVTSISDDLRTPLNSIISFTEILDKEYFGPLNDKQKNYLSWILKSSQQVKNFIDDVMDLAVMEAGQVTLHTKEFDVAKNLRAVVEEVRKDQHGKHFKINLKTAATTGKVTGDEQRLQHALLNILEDAIERIPAGAAIDISARGTKNLVHISFVYKNVEIPLFLREQLPGDKKPGKKPKSEKTKIGLRLSLARSILKLHGGEVDYDLIPDRDSTVKCTISRTFSKKVKEEETGETPATR
ncbi:MAG: HAMP domain-containing histidine kinase, partial [Proteobacteria bacterium]|nr:HAMP domain-containing histidine kinase [Pseudomonadota bacterium]